MAEHYVRRRGDSVGFWCPACDDPHIIDTSWTVDVVDSRNATVTPSILVTGGAEKRVCHSFLTDGVWHFLPDCTHDYAEQQAPMVPWPDGWEW